MHKAMDDQARGMPHDPEPDMPENVAVTGVAKGSLGTGTALEDTQEWVIPPELQASPTAQDAELAPAPAAASGAAPLATAATPRAAPQPAAARGDARAATDVGRLGMKPVAATPVGEGRPVRSRRATSRAGGGFAATPRAAGLAAVVLLALVGVAAIATSRDGTPGAVATPTEQATTTPTDAAPADAGGGDDEGSNPGNGNGKKDNDKGGGNGKGNNGGGNGGD